MFRNTLDTLDVLPDDVMYLIINMSSLSDIRTISYLGKRYSKLFNSIDWDKYLKSKLLPTALNLIEDCEINKRFMQVHGRHILPMQKPEYVREWLAFGPFIINLNSIFTRTILPEYYPRLGYYEQIQEKFAVESCTISLVEFWLNVQIVIKPDMTWRVFSYQPKTYIVHELKATLFEELKYWISTHNFHQINLIFDDKTWEFDRAE